MLSADRINDYSSSTPDMRPSAPVLIKIGCAALAGVVLILGAPAHAALSPFSGFWKLVSKEAPERPQLTPAAATASSKIRTQDDIDIEAVRWCVEQGLPYLMDNAGPIDIINGPSELTILAEKVEIGRAHV